ncbi:MAG: UvrD-helicase domain-containing protein [Clostridia bacterium]|nr:UvrD-helicase domain-containing protein [Clostridia bacterium]
MTEFITLRRQVQEREFKRLNPMQREAALHAKGPLLILAGAGSGKTTVLIQRIAHLVRFGDAYESEWEPPHSEADVALLRAVAAGERPSDAESDRLCAVDPCPPWKILAITFTNKAAGELKDRLAATLGDRGREVMAGTFHSFCARILRMDGDRLGYSSHFTIYDTDDSRRLMKDCLKALGFDDKALPHKSVLSEISRAKDRLCPPEQFAAEAGSDFRLKKVADAYRLYQQRLREADAMDFDDLLCKTVELLTTCPDVLERYQNRYEYILVDEYQDTNHAQYRLISLLAEKSGNLCVVGDDDQSIYQFRGATIENILSFEDEFTGCTVIRLEQNYRSTGNILDAANRVIAQNTRRKGKTLWTDNGDGDKLHEVMCENEDEEARFIADTILDNVAAGRHLRDHVILYRMNAQSNAIERALVKSGVPYRVIGGHRFYDSQEVRDAMAYLRLIQNPSDRVSLRRVVNVPRRGIGDTTMDHAVEIADGLGIPLYEVLRHAEDYPTLARSSGKLKAFTDLIDSLREKAEDETLSVCDLYTEMLDKTGYLRMWEAAGETEAGRVENLKELESSILSYEQSSPEPHPPLSGFLEEAALMTDADNYDAGADTVTMMTMHAAKGLEFPVVFLPGLEDGVFPGMQSLFEPDKVEEERRLCYVAITRAKEELYLLHASSRMLYGSTTHNRPSCFLGDIDESLIDKDDRRLTRGFDPSPSRPSYGGFGGKAAGFGGTRSSEPRRTAKIASTFLQQQSAPAASSAPASGERWQAGDLVSHRTFGDGEITAISPMGNDTLLTIRFETVGVKRLMANFAHLTRR